MESPPVDRPPRRASRRRAAERAARPTDAPAGDALPLDAGGLRLPAPNSADPAGDIADHLRRRIEQGGHDLAKLSRGVLGRAPDYLSKMLRGERMFRVADLLALLDAIGVEPGDFFAELYDLYRPEQLGAEIVPGMFEGQLRRLVEEAAREAAVQVAAGKGRAALRGRRRLKPPARPAEP